VSDDARMKPARRDRPALKLFSLRIKAHERVQARFPSATSRGSGRLRSGTRQEIAEPRRGFDARGSEAAAEYGA
jgi:hypothetical protein